MCAKSVLVVRTVIYAFETWACRTLYTRQCRDGQAGHSAQPAIEARTNASDNVVKRSPDRGALLSDSRPCITYNLRSNIAQIRSITYEFGGF